MKDSFGARSTLELDGRHYEYYRLDAVRDGHVDRLPYSLKILLENLLRYEDGVNVTREDIQAVLDWDAKATPSYEIDFTPARVPEGETCVRIRAYMAHHQGMSLLAFAHVLLDQPMQRRFMSDPLVRATELLLQERVPKQGATLHPHAAEVSAAARPPGADVGSIMRVFTEPNTRVPEVHLLSNGRYHVMATHAGGSSSRWRDLADAKTDEDRTKAEEFLNHLATLHDAV